MSQDRLKLVVSPDSLVSAARDWAEKQMPKYRAVDARPVKSNFEVEVELVLREGEEALVEGQSGSEGQEPSEGDEPALTEHAAAQGPSDGWADGGKDAASSEGQEDTSS